MEEAWNFFDDVLPPEVTMMVFSHFSIEDVLYVSLVCKTWNTYFDTKQLWKQIYELYFGQLNAKTVDLTQQLKWKRLFFSMSAALKWKPYFLKLAKTFAYTAQFFDIRPESKNRAFISGKNHIITSGSLTSVVDLKMAGKLVQVKHNPVSLLNHRIYINDNELKQTMTAFDPKPKSEYVLPYPFFKYASYGNGYPTADGNIFLRETNSYPDHVLLLWEHAVHARADKIHNIQYINTMWHYTAHSLNRKFVVGVYNHRFHPKYIIIDVSVKCIHCAWRVWNAKKHCYESDAPPNCSEGCAVIHEGNDCVDAFASSADPDKILLFSEEKVYLWRRGEERQVLVSLSKPSERFSLKTEHVTEQGQARHWFAYSTAEGTTFLDLNDCTNRFSIPPVQSITWVPKKNRAVVTMDGRATVLDLDGRTWRAKMTCPSPITALTFNRTASLLFLVDWDHIHAWHWETGTLLGSVPHGCGVEARVQQLDLVYDQLFCLLCKDGVRYFKCMSKCDM